MPIDFKIPGNERPWHPASGNVGGLDALDAHKARQVGQRLIG